MQLIELLADERRHEQADAGNVAAGPVEACDQAVADGIGSTDKHDRSCGRCGLCRFCRIGATCGEEHIDLTTRAGWATNSGKCS